MARKPTPRFDYEYLAGLVSSEAPREVFLLDEAAQSVLSDLAEIVRWDTRWDNADLADLGFIEFRSEIYEALKVPYHLDDLIPLLDEVEPLLRQLITSQCCYTGTDPLTPPGDATYEITPIGIEQTEPNTDIYDDTTWPPNWEAEGSGEPVFEDLAELSDYLCRAASTVFDMMLDMLTVAGWYFQLSSGVTVIMREVIQVVLARLFPSATGTIVAFAFDNIDGWLQAVEDGITRAAIETAKTELEAARAAIVCAMANAQTWQEAVTDVQAILNATLTSSVVNAWMISGGLVGFAIGLLFRAWADPVDNVCECAYDGFSLVDIPIISASKINGGTMSLVGDYYVYTGTPSPTNADHIATVNKDAGYPAGTIGAMMLLQTDHDLAGGTPNWGKQSGLLSGGSSENTAVWTRYIVGTPQATMDDIDAQLNMDFTTGATLNPSLTYQQFGYDNNNAVGTFYFRLLKWAWIVAT